jgi:uncharacterized protein (TIGR03437 family)
VLGPLRLAELCDYVVDPVAGAAPGFLGLQQVNVAVPADLLPVTSSLTICVMASGNQPYCSQHESIALKP